MGVYIMTTTDKALHPMEPHGVFKKVVVATGEDAARRLAAQECGGFPDLDPPDNWLKKVRSNCFRIDQQNYVGGVICAEYV